MRLNNVINSIDGRVAPEDPTKGVVGVVSEELAEEDEDVVELVLEMTADLLVVLIPAEFEVVASGVDLEAVEAVSVVPTSEDIAVLGRFEYIEHCAERVDEVDVSGGVAGGVFIGAELGGNGLVEQEVRPFDSG